MVILDRVRGMIDTPGEPPLTSLFSLSSSLLLHRQEDIIFPTRSGCGRRQADGGPSPFTGKGILLSTLW